MRTIEELPGEDKMLRYIGLTVLVLSIEIGFLYVLSLYFAADFMSTLFIGASLFIVIAFILSSDGDLFTKFASRRIRQSKGSYKARREKLSLHFTITHRPILCLATYFVMYYGI